jgi:hypothetical protein
MRRALLNVGVGEALNGVWHSLIDDQHLKTVRDHARNYLTAGHSVFVTQSFRFRRL